MANASAAVASGGREVRRIDVVRAIGRGGPSEGSLEAVSGMVGVPEVGGVDIVRFGGLVKGRVVALT